MNNIIQFPVGKPSNCEHCPSKSSKRIYDSKVTLDKKYKTKIAWQCKKCNLMTFVYEDL